jgi:hypothetical protein
MQQYYDMAWYDVFSMPHLDMYYSIGCHDIKKSSTNVDASVTKVRRRRYKELYGHTSRGVKRWEWTSHLYSSALVAHLRHNL